MTKENQEWASFADKVWAAELERQVNRECELAKILTPDVYPRRFWRLRAWLRDLKNRARLCWLALAGDQLCVEEALQGGEEWLN